MAISPQCRGDGVIRQAVRARGVGGLGDALVNDSTARMLHIVNIVIVDCKAKRL